MTAQARQHHLIGQGQPPAVRDIDDDVIERMEHSIHDLSQPLTSICFALELIPRVLNESTSRLLVEQAQGECNRAIEEIVSMRELLHELTSARKTRERVAA